MAHIFKTDTFEQEALKSKLPVLVDFYADWCPPCRIMLPIIEDLAAKYEGKALIGKLNTDEHPSIAAKYKVMTIPTLIFIKDGIEVDRIVNVTDPETIIEKLGL